MSIVVTGGAGFIGSCMVRTLNNAGFTDIIIVDNIASTEKWKNLCNKRFTEYINKNSFTSRLNDLKNVSHVLHLGACSSTTEVNFDYLVDNNLNYTKTLWKWCTERSVPFLYASSAATYGDGSCGYDDTYEIDELQPLNGYGYSKQLFDLWAKQQEICPPQHVGFKFFNVYGPNEYHKGSMSSVILHAYREIQRGKKIQLFRSYRSDYADGGQLRDFVYVKDVCSVIMYFMNHPELSGLYNVGTGQAESFRDLATAVANAKSIPLDIEYIDMPETLRAKYQYYTEANIGKLRNVGYQKPFMDLQEGVRNYILNYLEKGDLIY